MMKQIKQMSHDLIQHLKQQHVETTDTNKNDRCLHFLYTCDEIIWSQSDHKGTYKKGHSINKDKSEQRTKAPIKKTHSALTVK